MKAAADILREARVPASPPTDLTRILQHYGIRLGKYDFMAAGQGDVAGYVRRDKGLTTIWVEINDPSYRQRFTIAHELGHYFLHDETGDMEWVELRTPARTLTERQVDNFAADLLMPEEWLRVEHQKQLFPTLNSLASRFEVSPTAMRIRLKHMGLPYYE